MNFYKKLAYPLSAPRKAPTTATVIETKCTSAKVSDIRVIEAMNNLNRQIVVQNLLNIYRIIHGKEVNETVNIDCLIEGEQILVVPNKPG